jgi:hypothetical protein
MLVAQHRNMINISSYYDDLIFYMVRSLLAFFTPALYVCELIV